jgi:capsular polysaccharide biosynthesis protein
LIACALLGLLIPIVASSDQRTSYVSSVRILVTAASSSKSDASSAADEVAAIATTQPQVASALFYAHADRDPSTFVHNVSAEAVGSSGIVNLDVEDTDPIVAAAVANSLAAAVVDVMNKAGIAENPLPYVIEGATPSSARAVPPTRIQDLVLGVLFGLVVGIVAAAVLEALRPTVVGNDALAAASGAPVLGTLPGMGESEWRDLSSLGWRLWVQASRNGLSTMYLTSVGESLDLEALAAALEAAPESPQDPETRSGATRSAQPALRIRALDPTDVRSFNAGKKAGLVIVAPTVVKRAALEPVRDVLALTGWPALGMITYQGRRSPRSFERLVGKDRAIRPWPNMSSDVSWPPST